MGTKEERATAAERKGAPCLRSKLSETGMAVQLCVRVIGKMAKVSLCLHGMSQPCPSPPAVVLWWFTWVRQGLHGEGVSFIEPDCLDICSLVLYIASLHV